MTESSQLTTPVPDIRKEAPWALAYFAVYLGYLCVSLEGEILHWLTLVLLPFVSAYLYQKQWSGTSTLKSTLAGFGLTRRNLLKGLPWAILIGLLLSGLQLYLSRDRDQILAFFRSGEAAYLFPMALVLMLFTAGFTEEFFFRGFLQTRLQQWFSSKVWAVIITSLLFGIYHLPYAYLNPHWPSHGNLSAAVSSALGQGIPVGLILGTLYVRSENNLLPCIVVHALLNALPAMALLSDHF